MAGDALIIGDNVGFRLECQRMTQKTLSAATGIPYATISNCVRGLSVPSAANLKRIADALGVTTDELLEGVAE